MRKILYVVSTLQRTGPTNVLFNLIDSLNKSEFEPIILTLSQEPTGFPSLKDSFIEQGVKVHSISRSRISGFIYARGLIREFVKKHQIDVIHNIGFRPDWLIKKADYKNLSIISTINSNIYDDYTMLYGSRKGKIMAQLHIKSLKGKMAVACSRAVADALLNRFQIRLKVILNGIPKNLYSICSLAQKSELRKELGLPQDKHIFIFVGYLIYRKDPLTAIDGFLSMTHEKDSILIVMGDGPLMDDCKQRCSGVNNVIFLGNQPQTLKYLNASDYYIASSYSEGLPTSVMEAMGCGLPVILSDIAPHKELTDIMGDWPYCFPVNEKNSLSEKLSAVVESDYSYLSNKCRSVIESKVNSILMAEAYQDLYKS